MRHFRALVVILLAAITFELGLIIIKLPTPTAQAQVSAATYPTADSKPGRSARDVEEASGRCPAATCSSDPE